MVKEITKDKIMINKGMLNINSKGLRLKEDHFLLGTIVFFLVIIFNVTIINIRLYIVELMEGIFKKMIEESTWLP